MPDTPHQRKKRHRMKIEQRDLNRISALRKELHQHPELSGREINTAGKMAEFLRHTRPDPLMTALGGHGIAAIYDSGQPGPAVLFRCELDALPIRETSGLPHQSVHAGIGHLCGHDGHMSILAGLAGIIAQNPPRQGKAVLLFQPAEETGMGAASVLADPAFTRIRPDWVFALHNLPGFELNQIILADPVFSAGSIGMEIELTGKTSHAAEPENGINPAMAVSRIIRSYLEMTSPPKSFRDFVLITIIQVALGEEAYGTSAGQATLRATLRAFRPDDLDRLISWCETEARRIAADENLRIAVSTTEEFPVTQNHPEATRRVQEICGKNGWPVTELAQPFRWSEDFGHFTKEFKGALIGLGAGKTHPKLHHPDYDFPEPCLAAGIDLFSEIYHHFHISQSKL